MLENAGVRMCESIENEVSRIVVVVVVKDLMLSALPATVTAFTCLLSRSLPRLLLLPSHSAIATDLKGQSYKFFLPFSLSLLLLFL